MRAAVVEELRGPGAVRVRDLPEPSAGPGEVTIRVHAAGVSHLALGQTRGEGPARREPPFVPGAEVAGTVLAAPPGSELAPGDRVVALGLGGGFAGVAVARAAHTFALPDGLTFEQGAAVLVDYLTAYHAVVRRGGLAPGEAVLVRGAESGVGLATAQVAKAFGAGRVVAAVPGEPEGKVALGAGADAVVPAEGFRDAVRAVGPVDLVVDPVGGDAFVDALRCLAVEGRAVAVAAAGGTRAEFRVNRLLLNNIDVVAADWTSWALAAPDRIAGVWSEVAPHLASGALAPVVDAVRDLDGTASALAALDEGRARGKLVLRL
ncbi:zinc-binding dehydrogenase [Phytohabitans kaempferiae]|uniref:Zinc-binding dehydrogenase n=1 Tax=Phytohabitans kaempferiae TaxID=1620943 RepID=A0ABV6M5P9_9ACTN